MEVKWSFLLFHYGAWIIHMPFDCWLIISFAAVAEYPCVISSDIYTSQALYWLTAKYSISLKSVLQLALV